MNLCEFSVLKFHGIMPIFYSVPHFRFFSCSSLDRKQLYIFSIPWTCMSQVISWVCGAHSFQEWSDDRIIFQHQLEIHGLTYISGTFSCVFLWERNMLNFFNKLLRDIVQFLNWCTISLKISTSGWELNVIIFHITQPNQICP